MKFHLIYIHGFQGNDTSFQSFPTDLHTHLSTGLSTDSEISFRSCLYPTYKSVKPLSFATANFLEWLSMQPPGPVILLGHSMGGLLAAEAATDKFNNPDSYPGAKPRRIVGVVAFDSPYLGMHPHVVIPGIASLLPKEKKTLADMNDQSVVDIVDGKVTDDWETTKNERFGTSAPNTRSSGSSLSMSHRIRDFLANPSDVPIVSWARKHQNASFTAGQRSLVEHFQFASSMFDPKGLNTRYAHLCSWNGLWVNYWTETVVKSPKSAESGGARERSAAALSGDDTTDSNSVMEEASVSECSAMPSEITPSGYFLATDSNGNGDADDANLKQEKMKKMKKPRHFVIVPKATAALVVGGAEKWEKVVIGGVDDEVHAHCGLFKRGHNLDYDGLVRGVGERILGWSKEVRHWEYY